MTSTIFFCHPSFCLPPQQCCSVLRLPIPNVRPSFTQHLLPKLSAGGSWRLVKDGGVKDVVIEDSLAFWEMAIRLRVCPLSYDSRSCNFAWILALASASECPIAIRNKM